MVDARLSSKIKQEENDDSDDDKNTPPVQDIYIPNFAVLEEIYVIEQCGNFAASARQKLNKKDLDRYTDVLKEAKRRVDSIVQNAKDAGILSESYLHVVQEYSDEIIDDPASGFVSVLKDIDEFLAEAEDEDQEESESEDETSVHEWGWAYLDPDKVAAEAKKFGKRAPRIKDDRKMLGIAAESVTSIVANVVDKNIELLNIRECVDANYDQLVSDPVVGFIEVAAEVDAKIGAVSKQADLFDSSFDSEDVEPQKPTEETFLDRAASFNQNHVVQSAEQLQEMVRGVDHISDADRCWEFAQKQLERLVEESDYSVRVKNIRGLINECLSKTKHMIADRPAVGFFRAANKLDSELCSMTHSSFTPTDDNGDPYDIRQHVPKADKSEQDGEQTMDGVISDLSEVEPSDKLQQKIAELDGDVSVSQAMNQLDELGVVENTGLTRSEIRGVLDFAKKQMDDSISSDEQIAAYVSALKDYIIKKLHASSVDPQSHVIEVPECGRCGKPHDEVVVDPFQRPIKPSGPITYTHWFACPETGEPCIVTFEEVDEDGEVLDSEDDEPEDTVKTAEDPIQGIVPIERADIGDIDEATKYHFLNKGNPDTVHQWIESFNLPALTPYLLMMGEVRQHPDPDLASPINPERIRVELARIQCSVLNLIKGLEECRGVPDSTIRQLFRVIEELNNITLRVPNGGES